MFQKLSSQLSVFPGQFLGAPLSLKRVVYLVGGLFGLTYLLFQKKLLPLPVAKVVSKILFFPTFPITAALRLGNYWSVVDETLILGCAPFSIFGHPDSLYRQGVRGVINMCYEYEGPKGDYKRLGMKQLYLPTVDHTEPSVEKLQKAVEFIKDYQSRGERVYVHCKAGHGRAASVALSWLINQNKKSTPKVSFARIYAPNFLSIFLHLQDLNVLLRSKRFVRTKLHEQKNIAQFKAFVDSQK
jgi:atypical dual specificity phosphatase